MIAPGQRITVRVEKAVAGGRMLARHEGAIVLVAPAIPGELVEAEVEKTQRGTIWAATRHVLEPSPDRLEPFCDWECGGTVYAHVRYERQLDLKREVLRDAFTRLARLALPPEIPIAPSPVDGHRMRARLHRRDGRIGFFREGTHELCDAGSTRQLLPGTVDALSRLEAALRDAPRVEVVEIELAENCEATERAVHLELDADSEPSTLAAHTRVEGLTGVSCAIHHQSRMLTLWGSPAVIDELHLEDGPAGAAPIRLARHARAFFQSNRFLLGTLVAHVARAVPRGPVLDLYAGVGLFSVALACRGGGEVVAVEGDSIAAADLETNAKPCGSAIATLQQPVEAFFSSRHSRKPFTTVIVDPPRTGMSRDALKGISSLSPPHVVYVSCDVATLARDTRILMDSGYRLSSLEAFDMFPNTAHVETVAVFERGAKVR